MTWTITERFPSWGETGSMPAAGFFYEGGDQVNEKHMDALWNSMNGLEEDVQAALNDIDADADGTVDAADIANALNSTEVGDGLNGGDGVELSVDVTDLLGTGLTEASNNFVLNETSIKDGGAKETDASEFSGDLGTDGQVLATDGTSASWTSKEGTDPIYGGGEDGSVLRTTNGTEPTYIHATSFTIDSGVTRTVDGLTVIHATDKIEINGTLDANGQGGTGGAGGSGGQDNSAASRDEQEGGDGASGTAADWLDGGSGGDSGSTSTGSNGGAAAGGGGGDGSSQDWSGARGGTGGNSGGQNLNAQQKKNTYIYNSPASAWADIYSNTFSAGAGAGGGGGGAGGNGGDGGSGGSGGTGGGAIILVAPEITINGTVTATGISGSNGEDALNSGGGGGGGGGGNGGLLVTMSQTYSLTGTIDLSGGAGGVGGTSDSAYAGGDGGGGNTGEHIKVAQ